MPFYRLLPPVLSTNLGSAVTLDYMPATAALTATSFMCLVISCVGIWRLALHRRRPPVVATGAAMLLFVACRYTQIVALGMATIAAIVAGLWLLPYRQAFTPFMIWLTLRCLFDHGDRTALALSAACLPTGISDRSEFIPS